MFPGWVVENDLDAVGAAGKFERLGELLGGQAMGDQTRQPGSEFGVVPKEIECPVKIAAARTAELQSSCLNCFEHRAFAGHCAVDTHTPPGPDERDLFSGAGPERCIDSGGAVHYSNVGPGQGARC